MENHFDTIVIGAGISGLTCASRLHANQTSNSQRKICVLEARDRIGGRINSVYVKGSRLDTGANWIHGTGTKHRPNPLMGILPHKRFRALSGTVTFRPPRTRGPVPKSDDSISSGEEGWVHVSAESKPRRRESSGDLVIPSQSAGKLMGSVWSTIESLHEISHTIPAAEADRTSMLSALTDSDGFRNAFQDVSPEYHAALSGMPQFLEPMEAAPLVAQSAEHAEGSAGFSLSEFAINDFDGDQVFLQDGYIAIINEIAQPLLDAGIVQTGVKVEEIDWNVTPISLKTSSGCLYTANQVVCTLPLGVLKHRSQASKSHPALFNPPLPREKIRSISSLGFGTLDKIFLVYHDPWWTEEPYASILEKGFSRRRPFTSEEDKARNLHGTANRNEPDSFMGFTHELPGFSISEKGKVEIGPRLLSIINLHSLCGFPVLCAFVSCANAAHMETLSDTDASGLIHRSLDSWFGRETPTPEAVHVTRWASDPCSYGSYSHMITGVSSIEDRGEFATAVKTRGEAQLRFAGEHTSRNHFATAHGALLSGWREADALLASHDS